MTWMATGVRRGLLFPKAGNPSAARGSNTTGTTGGMLDQPPPAPSALKVSAACTILGEPRSVSLWLAARATTMLEVFARRAGHSVQTCEKHYAKVFQGRRSRLERVTRRTGDRRGARARGRWRHPPLRHWSELMTPRCCEHYRRDRLGPSERAKIIEDVRLVYVPCAAAASSSVHGWLCCAVAPSLAQLVEHFHGKEGVAGSSPLGGSPR